jgi:hypothetical protein
MAGCGRVLPWAGVARAIAAFSRGIFYFTAGLLSGFPFFIVSTTFIAANFCR